MKHCILVVVALVAPDWVLAEEREVELPKPDCTRDASDPDWLAYAAQFHGHLGPWATAGLRLGVVGRRAVGAEGYFDVNVVVEGPFVKPPRSCLLDGVQVATGATWGKRNISWAKSDAILIRVTNTRTGRVAEVKPTKRLLELLTSFRSGPKIAPAGNAKQDVEDDGHHKALEAIARKIARLPASEILTVKVRGSASGEVFAVKCVQSAPHVIAGHPEPKSRQDGVELSFAPDKGEMLLWLTCAG